MFIALPSGRRLAYVQPSIGENQWGNPSITYWGVGANKKWQVLENYGGKLVENIVQAIARDLLTHALHTLGKAGHRIVMHVHDEAVIDEPYDSGATVESVCKLMAAHRPGREASHSMPTATNAPSTRRTRRCRPTHQECRGFRPKRWDSERKTCQ